MEKLTAQGYELKENETFKDLIQSWCLKITAYLDRAQIDRVMPFNKRKMNGKILCC